MAAAPVEVGAQGTVGSLVLREVEYFRRMEVVAGGHSKKSSSKVVAASGGGGGGGSPWSNSKKPAKKKKDAVAGSGSFLPRMCSSAEVAEDPGSGRRERPSRVRYRPLGDDGDALPQLD
jgi:hypothetical protein